MTVRPQVRARAHAADQDIGETSARVRATPVTAYAPGMTKEPPCARRTGSIEAGADGGGVPAMGVLQE